MCKFKDETTGYKIKIGTPNCSVGTTDELCGKIEGYEQGTIAANCTPHADYLEVDTKGTYETVTFKET